MKYIKHNKTKTASVTRGRFMRCSFVDVAFEGRAAIPIR